MKNKKAILALALLFGAAFGFFMTMAYNTDRATLNNDFTLGTWKTVFEETFDAPSNWITCETISKEITVKNESNVKATARIRLEEQWLKKDGTQLPIVSEVSGYQLAQINFLENSGWTYHADGYYYYDTDLEEGETTQTLTTGVTLNCDANLNEDADYANADYHLTFTAQTIQADAKNEWNTSAANIIEEQAGDPTTGGGNGNFEIDFTRKAMISEDVALANGNGVNAFVEYGRPIYYYRGNVDNNNVIWRNVCWKMIRTTMSGGIKMIYNGDPTTVDGVKQCNATGAATQINSRNYRFNGSSWSPADSGYKYGVRLEVAWQTAGSTEYTFANKVSRSGSTYTLDTSYDQSIHGTWANKRQDAAKRYHYFCTNGATTCSGSRIGYINYFGDETTIYYFHVNGYGGIEAMKDAMFTNTNNSVAKNTIESWFEAKGLNIYEDELEDVVFCNDRRFIAGSLYGEDSDASAATGTEDSLFGAYGYAFWRNAKGNLEPNLGCATRRDSFTKSSANGNGQLKYKVGLITASEMTLAGLPLYNPDDETAEDTDNYLYTSYRSWSISPFFYPSNYSGNFIVGHSSMTQNGVYDERGLRPVVSLKAGMEFASGSGSKADPFIVKQ